MSGDASAGARSQNRGGMLEEIPAVRVLGTGTPDVPASTCRGRGVGQGVDESQRESRWVESRDHHPGG